MSYKPGFCCGCNAQTWATDFLGHPTMPLSNIREGYIVFQFGSGKTRLKVSICDACEKTASADSCVSWLASLKGANCVPEADLYTQEALIGYEPFRKIWDDLGMAVTPIHERALGGRALSSERRGHNG